LLAEPAALGSDLYSRLEGIAGIKSPSLPGSKNAGSNSENGAETKGLFSTSDRNIASTPVGLAQFWASTD